MKNNNRKLQQTVAQDIPTDLMLDYGGRYYVLDVDTLVEKSTIHHEDDGDAEDELHFQRYEIYKTMIEVIITPMEEENEDSALAAYKIQKTPFDFKLAYNTLLKEGILKAL